MKQLPLTILASAMLISAVVLYSTGNLNFLIKTPEWKQQVLERLIDPDSAQFRDIKTSDINRTCGSVKSKNGFGGYTNWVKFMVEPPTDLKGFENSNWKVTFETDYTAGFLVVLVCGR